MRYLKTLIVLLLTTNSFCVAQEIEWDTRFEAGLQYNVESNLFWAISDDFAPEAGFEKDGGKETRPSGPTTPAQAGVPGR